MTTTTLNEAISTTYNRIREHTQTDAGPCVCGGTFRAFTFRDVRYALCNQQTGFDPNTSTQLT